jgi:hypothetical protein
MLFTKRSTFPNVITIMGRKEILEVLKMLQDKTKDLVEKVKKENPKMGEQEVYFQAQKEYEELLVSQVNSLEIVIL